MKDMIDNDWLVVVKTNPRDHFNMPEVEEATMNEESYLQEDDVEPQTVLRTNNLENEEDNFINENHILYLGVKKLKKSY